ncbi:IS5 family transposase [Asaia siamensis]
MEHYILALLLLGRAGCVQCAAGDAGGTGWPRPVGRHNRRYLGSGTSLRCQDKKDAGPTEGLGRSRGGFTTKRHARCDARVLPLAFILTPEQAHDQQGSGPRFQAISGRLDKLLADRGYDAGQIPADIAYAGARPVIPAKRGRRNPASHDRHAYKLKNRIERMFNRLKNWRRFVTRYDKTVQSYLSFVSIASAGLAVSTNANCKVLGYHS